MIKRICTLFFLITTSFIALHAHLPQGNLALPSSQQPGPLFGFGQNIVDKGNIQAFAYTDYLGIKRGRFVESIPFVLYGISDRFSLMLAAPIALQFTVDHKSSSGMSDALIQLEYAFYDYDSDYYNNTLTIVGNMTFPTGSGTKDPPTGIGTPTVFLGLTASHTGHTWYGYLSTGGVLVTSRYPRNFRHTFLYQGGIGRNIYYISEEQLMCITLELFGTQSKNGTILSSFFQNFSDNSCYLGPSIWFATKQFILNTGFAFPVAQQSKDNDKSNVLVSFELGWKFN